MEIKKQNINHYKLLKSAFVLIILILSTVGVYASGHNTMIIEQLEVGSVSIVSVECRESTSANWESCFSFNTPPGEVRVKCLGVIDDIGIALKAKEKVDNPDQFLNIRPTAFDDDYFYFNMESLPKIEAEWRMELNCIGSDAGVKDPTSTEYTGGPLGGFIVRNKEGIIGFFVSLVVLAAVIFLLPLFNEKKKPKHKKHK